MDESTIMSPQMTDALNYLGLGLSILLLIVVAYLFIANSRKSDEIAKLQKEVARLRRDVNGLDERVNQIRQPKIIEDVPQVEPFGIDFSTPNPGRMTPLEPQKPWLDFVAQYNELAETMSKPGQLKKCERFIHEHKLRILTYGGAMTFRPAIDAKDSSYWAFKCSSEEFAVVPNPMKPCDEEFYAHGGMKETFALNYKDGIYRKYFVKLPALFEYDPTHGWKLTDSGVVNLERN